MLQTQARRWLSCLRFDPALFAIVFIAAYRINTLATLRFGAKMKQDELFQSPSQPQRLTRWQPSDWPLAQGWGEVVAAFLSSATGQALAQAVQARLRAGACIFPPAPFRALELTPLDKVRVVILGQDPYHGAGQAEGLAFSVAPGIKIPPSLRNIFKEIQRERAEIAGGLGAPGLAGPRNVSQNGFQNGSLSRWAEQGVLLLNTCLTVEEGLPASHAKLGWEVLTNQLIALVAKSNKNVVFMLWGAHAQAKQALLQNHVGAETSQERGHLVLCANHPSPLSALRPPLPFLGCNHFKLANEYLRRNGGTAIEW